MFKLLVFDLDGTLIDSAPDIHRAVNRFFKERNLPQQDLATVKKNIGMGLKHLLYKLDSKFADPKVYQRFLDLYEEEAISPAVFMSGVDETLSRWKGPKALVTNKSWTPTFQILKNLKYSFSDWIFIGTNHAFPRVKPHPGPLLQAMHVANVKSRETLMLGDSTADIGAAHAAGCWSAAMMNGYGEAKELRSCNADFYFKSMNDLLGYI